MYVVFPLTLVFCCQSIFSFYITTFTSLTSVTYVWSMDAGYKMVYTPLPALRINDYRARICIRVTRKWEYRGPSDDGPLQHIDLVLADHQVRLRNTLHKYNSHFCSYFFPSFIPYCTELPFLFCIQIF